MRGTCKYCGKRFNKRHNRQEYCPKCKRFAYQDQNVKHQRNFRNRLKQNGFMRNILGSKGASLGAHPNTNFEVEVRLIENQLRAFNLK